MSRFDLRRLRSREELLAVGREVGAELKSNDVPSLAAAVAFKIVLALFPSLVAAIGIFAMVYDPDDLPRLLDMLAGVAPDGVVDFLEDPLDRLIAGRAAGLAAVAGIVGGLWAASGAAATLNKALSTAYDLSDDRKLVAARVAALLVTAALLAALIGIFVLVVAGGAIEDRVLASLPLTDSARGVFDFLSTVGRYVLVTVALMLLFAFIYWIGPDYDARPTYPWISPGAALGVLTWLVASALFGLYANNFGSYGDGSVYGPLGNAILFMIWLQLSMLALLLGAEVNQVLQLRAAQRVELAEVAGFGGEPAVGVSVAPPARRGRAARATARSPVGADGAGGVARRTARADGATGAPDRALDVRRHDVATDGPGDHERPSTITRPRRVPTDAVAGAVVAGLSGMLGLIGLLRNRRRE